jgi:2,4-dienoyl-CoA reductase-like NADH-dependent reductase (Old Yellow Enzyme family)
MSIDLFSPFELKDVTLRNRIAVPPMCQYSAVDGVPNDWHFSHYGALGQGGAGLIVVEATAVSADGRITPGCLGIWNDAQAEQHRRIVAVLQAHGAVPGLQIAHAGMKASANVPWEGDDHLPQDDPRAWQTIAPSAVPFGTPALSRVPREMTLSDIERVKHDYVTAAQRALTAGYKWLELHFAHGYLAQSFLSRHTNKRSDAYGGSAENRGRFILETLQAVRKVWPSNLPLAMRLGIVEFDGTDEQTLGDSIALLKECKAAGLDLVNASIGFSTPNANVPWGPGFLTPYAERVRNETGLPVVAAWGYDEPAVAADVIASERLDLVMMGHAHLRNPHYTYQLAKALGKDQPAWVLPAPYAHWLSRR